jgi:probable rRNA maturation factor
MILLDPDLNQGPKRRLHSALPPIGVQSSRGPGSERIPTISTLQRFLVRAGEAVRLKGEVSVLLTTDAALRKLNWQFRRKNKATDVLSFPPEEFIGSKEKIAGDLAISVETARKQAAEQGHALTNELKILMLHGLLHLAGYDHETDDGAMARREMKLRAKLGLPQGLIERTVSPTLSYKGPRKDGARNIPQGLKPKTRLRAGSARLKSSPDSKPLRVSSEAGSHSGAKAHVHSVALTARLKSGPDTKLLSDGISSRPGKSSPDTNPKAVKP